MLNKTAILNNVTRTFHKGLFQIKKHSPEILVVGGVVGTVASAVMACKATTKVNSILENAAPQLEKINDAKTKLEAGQVLHVEDGSEYTLEDCKKDSVIVYTQTAVEFVKLYGPSVLLGVVSITSILAGHNILRKRNMALAAAYALESTSFKEYRDRVIERFGEALDKELKYDVKAKEVEEVVVNEDGTETVVKKTVEVVDPNNISLYARIFDDGCKGWDKDPELNLMTLRQVQAWANDKLQRQGYLFLNDVYKALGFSITSYGQVVGWVYNEKNPIGDNFVDFGIYDIHNPANRNFVNGYERNILLDFNVDGNILELI